MALIPSELHFDAPNLSYEETVLFMVANYQYLTTCVAFSIAKPFRKPIWTNYAFVTFIVFLFIFDAICVFAPGESGVATLFNLNSFKTEDGNSHYSYRYWIVLGIVINSIMTYVAEKFIINVVTKRCDA